MSLPQQGTIQPQPTAVASEPETEYRPAPYITYTPQAQAYSPQSSPETTPSPSSTSTLQPSQKQQSTPYIPEKPVEAPAARQSAVQKTSQRRAAPTKKKSAALVVGLIGVTALALVYVLFVD